MWTVRLAKTDVSEDGEKVQESEETRKSVVSMGGSESFVRVKKRDPTLILGWDLDRKCSNCP
jgi:hypothetical protein